MSLILPPQLKALAAMTAKETLRYPGAVGVQEEKGETHTTFTATDGRIMGIVTVPNNQLVMAPGDERFPNCEKALPKSDPVLTIRLDPKLLAKVLRAAIATGLDEYGSVEMSIHKEPTSKHHCLVFRSNGDDRTFTGALMCMTPSDK